MVRLTEDLSLTNGGTIPAGTVGWLTSTPSGDDKDLVTVRFDVCHFQVHDIWVAQNHLEYI